MTNLAISYARFSSVGQSEGDSLRRQAQKAEAYATKHDLLIDKELSFRDLGVSAYDQSNIRKGALGLFMKAVDEGRVPKGATLIVESFDRLSRAEPIDALGMFTDIIQSDLNLAILTDPPKVFNRASIKANTFQLFEALLDMHRAHEESKRKGDLVGSRWKEKKRLAASQNQLLSLKAPHWISVTINHDVPRDHPSRRSAVLNPERAPIALRIIEMAEAGIGNHTIIRTLNSEGVKPWSKRQRPKDAPDDWLRPVGRWEPSYMQKLLRSPALYGAIDLDGEITENFYPPLITYDRYIALQSLRSARASTTNYNRKGKNVTNLFTGLLKCGYCGSSMNIAGYKSRKGPNAGYERKYVACHGARIRSTKCKMKMWFIDELEPALLFWLTSLDFSKIAGTRVQSALDTESTALTVLEAKLIKAEARVVNTEDAIADGVVSMRKRLPEFEAERDRLAREAVDQRKKVAALRVQSGDGKSLMKAMVLLFRALKTTTDEVKVRAMREQLLVGINETVAKITLFPAGQRITGQKEDRFIDVLFRSGVERRIEQGEC